MVFQKITSFVLSLSFCPQFVFKWPLDNVVCDTIVLFIGAIVCVIIRASKSHHRGVMMMAGVPRLSKDEHQQHCKASPHLFGCPSGGLGTPI